MHFVINKSWATTTKRHLENFHRRDVCQINTIDALPFLIDLENTDAARNHQVYPLFSVLVPIFTHVPIWR